MQYTSLPFLPQTNYSTEPAQKKNSDTCLTRTLALYGLDARGEDLAWFAEAFWAQSIALKIAHGWRPPRAEDFPARVFETLSQTLGQPVDDLRGLMQQLIAEWERQAGALLARYGYEGVLG